MKNYYKTRELCKKPIGQLNSAEVKYLFKIDIDVNDENFKKSIKSISDFTIMNINTEQLKESGKITNDTEAYLLGRIWGMQSEILPNRIIVFIGEPASGKSHIINLIHELKKMDAGNMNFGKLGINNAKTGIPLKEFKELADSIEIIKKKSDRPLREGEKEKPEIQAGLPTEEVKNCELTYEYAGYTYGIPYGRTEKAIDSKHILLVANSIDVIEKLDNQYPGQVLPIYIFRTGNANVLKKLMKEGHRPKNEIKQRVPNKESPNYVYKNVFLKLFDKRITPHLIINEESYGVPNDALLGQLMNNIRASYIDSRNIKSVEQDTQR